MLKPLKRNRSCMQALFRTSSRLGSRRRRRRRWLRPTLVYQLVMRAARGRGQSSSTHQQMGITDQILLAAYRCLADSRLLRKGSMTEKRRLHLQTQRHGCRRGTPTRRLTCCGRRTASRHVVSLHDGWLDAARMLASLPSAGCLPLAGLTPASRIPTPPSAGVRHRAASAVAQLC